MKHALVIAVLMLATGLAACSDDSVQPKPPASPVTWQRDDIQGVTQQLVALQAGDDDLLVLGEGFFALVDPGIHTQRWYSILSFKANPVPFTGRDYFVYPIPNKDARLESRSIVINWRATGADAIPTAVQLPLPLLDPTLSADAFYTSLNRSNIAVVNDAGKMLVPVAEFKDGAFSPYLYLIQLDPAAPGDFSGINVTLERRIDWPYKSFPNVMTVNGRLYAANAWALYEVHEDGTFTKLLDHWAVDMIEHNGQLFANTYDGIYASADNGTSWTQSTLDVGGGRFFVADGRLCVLHDQGSIHAVNLDSDPVHAATNLNTDGLPYELSVWRAAVQFGDRVYIATNNGLYSKPIDHFFTPYTPR